MIYPSEFPLDNTNSAEKAVYDALKKISADQFDVYFGRKFAAIERGEKVEYEIDFLVADLRGDRLNALICLEVKGGQIIYDGRIDKWKQNHHHLDDPIKQVTGNMHSLVKRYADLAYPVPFGWGLVFPHTIVPDASSFPTVANPLQVFDTLGVQMIDRQIVDLCNWIRERNPNKRGADKGVYESFQKSLFQSLGIVIPLHKKFDLQEQRFIQLTEKQLLLLDLVAANQNILVKGPAGSGKTVLASTLAKRFYEEGKKVLLLTFNRILANNIRYNLRLPRDENRIEVATYHSICKRKIDEVDPEWWEAHSKEDDFWTEGAAFKLDDVLSGTVPEFDVLIIDEGQDFQELWFESLERLLKPEGSYYVFMDEHQNIFNAFRKVPGNRSFFNFPLTENCRNTKKIIDYLQQVVEERTQINQKTDTPEGDEVRQVFYRNDIEQLNLIKETWLHLVEQEGISPDRIVLMFNSLKKDSCIGSTRKLGKYPIEAVDRHGRMNPKAVNYTTINTFKGLEADVVFIIDTDKVENPDYKVLYTQASRAKYLLCVFIKP
ncbi:AAA family ATPase [Aquiflexum sp. LQ15W]|uniref:UvrD-helicase domain-containing protein n=1 Tax=Cognataquiflexum nitidum TaxID=2922272 RepID=UPI001F134D3C|nr:NERD domain-containing protein/DEAD/DEAH box helicase [Cognataquiflexum nitidum]MCH6198616.1 AAA family ATPase [Cognataquiflexum nitidum]